jgi:hypothetical protein
MLKIDHATLRSLAVALTLVSPMAVLVTAGAGPAMAQSGPEGEVDLETFYRELSPHGKWFEHSRWGEVWRPNVEGDWRPYTRGHWAWTDDHGWYWVAEEEWGWAPFHYGRWVFDDNEEEWLWIPGTEWAPAWVQWRESEDAVGWAPLPPDSLIDGGSLRVNQTYYDSPRFSRYWVFAPPALMFLPGLHRHIIPTSRHTTIWRSTRHVSFNHRFDRGRIYLPGVDHRRIERWSGRSVPVVSLRPVASPRATGWRHMPDRTTVPVFRPRVISRTDFQRPSRPAFGGNDRDGRPVVVVPGSRDRNRDGVPDWRQDRNRDGRPDVARPGQDRNRDGVPDVRQDRNRDGRPDWQRNGGDRGRDPTQDAARRAQEQARQQQQQQDAARRAQEQARQQQQQDAARRAQDQARQQQDAARRAQDAARQQQQDAARQQQDAARRAQETARQQQDAARQQQDAARRAQDAARQQKEQQDSARRAADQARRPPPPTTQNPAPSPGTAAGPPPETRRRDGDGKRRDGEGRDGKRREERAN